MKIYLLLIALAAALTTLACEPAPTGPSFTVTKLCGLPVGAVKPNAVGVVVCPAK